MQICNNLKTGQVFIHLDSQDKNKALMITPNGIVMALEYDLFTPPIEVEEKEALFEGLINRSQYNIFTDYIQH
jgi:hypothetical protein